MIDTFAFHSHPLERRADCTAKRLRLCLSIVVIGLVYFYVAHNSHVSQFERYAPWSDAENTLESGQNAAKGAALGLIGLLGVWLATRPGGHTLKGSGSLPWLMAAYVIWAVASILWSINPTMTCKRLGVVMFYIVAALGFARQFRPRDLAIMAMTITGGYLLIGIAAETALGTFRPWASDYRFAGTIHPNSQGLNLVVFCLAAYCLARSTDRKSGWLWTALAIGVLFLLLTKSRTSCAALVVALTSLGLVASSWRTRWLVVFCAVFMLFVTATAETLLGVDLDQHASQAVMLGRGEDSESLTGRLPIWAELLNYVAAKPLHGYGYESFWTAKHIEAVSDEMEWPLREAHNAFLDGVLSVGIIGVMLFLAVVAVSIRRAAVIFHDTRNYGAAFLLGLLAVGLINGCLESGMMGANFITLLGGAGIFQLGVKR